MGRRRLIKGFLAAGILTASAGAYYFDRPWKRIVIHHSAGDAGDIAFLNRVHRQRQKGDPIDSMAYHFAIGNGRGMPMGHVAWDMRWRWKLWGAHVSGRNTESNIYGIGICLIGNFEKKPVPEAQFNALLHLCRKLMNRHGIPPEEVVLHGAISGERTACPGKHLPWKRLARSLSV